MLAVCWLPTGTVLASLPPTDHDLAQDYLLSVYLAGELQTQSLPAHRKNHRLYLHFAEFIALAEFSIDPTEDGWRGWAYQQNNHFKLQLTEQKIERGNVHYPLSKQGFIEIEGELYISVFDLAQWFELSIKQQLADQKLYIQSTQLFAFQQRQLRQARVQYLNSVEKASAVEVPDQYRLWTEPRTFWQAQSQWSRQNDETNHSSSIAATSSFDLLHHQTFFSGNLSDSNRMASEKKARLTLSRNIDKENEVLFLGATNYSFGDIYLNKPGLMGLSGSGVGFDIKRHHQNGHNQSEGALITGDAPPGWDAELYKNGQLLGLIKVDGQGRYLFTDQPTTLGLNRFEVRIYGPQGQKESQVHQVWGGGLSLEQNQFSYRFSHIDYQQDLLNGSKENADQIVARGATTAQLQYGLTNHIQLGLAVYEVQGLWSPNRYTDEFNPSQSAETYLAAEVQADLFDGIGFAEWIKQENSAQAIALGYRGSFAEQQINYQLQHFDKTFYSPYTEQLGQLKLRQRLLFNGPLNYWLNNYQFNLTHDRLHVGKDKLSAKLRLSKHWQNWFMHHTFEYEAISGIDSRLKGKLEATTRLKHISISAGINYQFDHNLKATQALVTARWRPSDNIFANTQLSHTLGQSRLTVLQQQLSWQTDWGSINANISIGSDDYLAVGIGISSYFGDGQIQRRNLIHHARAKLQPFLDQNGNNRHDTGEPFITDAQFHQPHQASDSLTIQDIPAYYPTRVSLDKLSLPDPYMAATPKALSFNTHPGAMLHVPVPVSYTGDIEGYVALVDKQQEGIMGVQLSLLNTEGIEVAQALSEYDGYFSFTGVPAGRYQLRYTRVGGIKYEEQWISLDPEEGYLKVTILLNELKLNETRETLTDK